MMRHKAALIAIAAALGGCVQAGRDVPPPAAMTPTSAPSGVPKTYQWLHGSGEAAVLERQTYRALEGYVTTAWMDVERGVAFESAVLVPTSTPQAPQWASCDGRSKRPAVVFDIDETVLLNSGANYDSARRGDPPFDPRRWAEWERTGALFVEAVPGAVEAIQHLRERSITPIFITNRDNRFAAETIEALRHAGIGPAVHGETLFLAGDVAPGSAKDPRRAAVAAKWCVLAMVGDQLGDFSDQFNAKGLTPLQRRALATSPALAGKWQRGWFLLPNPVYGPGVAGTLDDLFPADTRWPGPSETH
jgi:5'-nucleotidase (lipoprotein e(P4) family)